MLFNVLTTSLRGWCMGTPQDEDERSRIFLAFAAISVVFVVLVMIVLVVALVASRVISVPQNNTVSLPYNIQNRSIPKPAKLSDLFPDKLGTFKRTALSGNLSAFGATYNDGKVNVTIQGSQSVSVRAAQAEILSASRSMNTFGVQKTNSDPGFVLDTSGQFRLVWSHDVWFFDVTAPSKAALDSFMGAFPY